MAKISNEILSLFSNIGNSSTSTLTQIPTSADMISSGDILVFDYNLPSSTHQRAVLIVRTKRGNGIFPGKSGKLVSCFKINGGSDSVIQLIMETLYNKRRTSDYYGRKIASLKTLIGRDSFRTYSLEKMRSIYKFNIK